MFSSVICMCNRCFELFHIDKLLIDEERYSVALCPKYGCYGRVSPVDELIVPMIQKLNKAGFATDYSCSGHLIGRDPSSKLSYISFCGIDPRDYIVENPALWYWDDNCLRSRSGNIYQRMINLDKWVDELIRIKKGE